MNPDNKTRLIIGLQEIVDKREKEARDMEPDDLEATPDPIDTLRNQLKTIKKAEDLLLVFIDDKEIRDLFEAAIEWYD